MTMRRGQERSVVVILGEDDNDRRSIQILVGALRPDIPRGLLRPLRKPMALVRNVRPQRLPSQVTKVSALLRAVEVEAPIRAVLMHEDADAVEPAHETMINKIESTYRSLRWRPYSRSYLPGRWNRGGSCFLTQYRPFGAPGADRTSTPVVTLAGSATPKRS